MQVRGLQPLPTWQAKRRPRRLQSGSRRSAGSASKRKREPEIKPKPEIKQEPEIKLEPEIKQEPFTIRGYFGICD